MPSSIGQDDRRLVERVDELGRDDADHAAVPSVAGHDEDVVGADAHVGLDLFLRVGDDVGLVRLAAGVLFAELLGESSHFVELRLVAGEQQARGQVGRAHATRGVHARRNHECDVEPVDRRVQQTGRFEQRAQADRVRPLRQPLQAELGDDPVLADERHDVSDRADRGKLQEGRQPFLAVEPLAQRLDDLERDTDAGQVLVRVRAVGALRVDHRERVRQAKPPARGGR